MIVTLKDKKQIEILRIDLKNSTLDFKWIDGAYGGECLIPIDTEKGKLPNAKEIEKACNTELAENKVELLEVIDDIQS